MINPGTMLGPLWNGDPGTSGEIVRRMLRGAMPMTPNIILDFVDVRDVAAAHVAALRDPAAAAGRNCCGGHSCRREMPLSPWAVPSWPVASSNEADHGS